MPPPEQPKATKKKLSLALLLQLAVSAFILAIVIWNVGRVQSIVAGNDESAIPLKIVPLAEGTWRFVVSGDSRNCGDVVMPAIAAHSSEMYKPTFYWHLGDLRAVYKIDEDM